MTRNHLRQQNGIRGRYTGQVSRFGTKIAFHGPPLKTLCLVDVRDGNGVLVTDHLWFTMGKQFERLQLVQGDRVSFEARVTLYIKGYRGHRDDVYLPITKDYRLSNPSKIVKQAPEPITQPQTIYRSPVIG